MLRALADLAHRRPKRVLALTGIFAVVAGVIGGPVPAILTSSNSFEDPASQSVRARHELVSATGVDASPGLIALVRAGRDVRSVPARAGVERLAAFLRVDPAVAQAATYFDHRDPRLLSRDGTETYLPVTFRASADDGDAAERIAGALARDPRVTIGGGAITGNQVGEQVQGDLAVAELLAFPILFVLSLLIFRSLVAALLPLFVGGVAIVGTFLALRGLNELTSLSVFAVNLVTGLGLGLAIDYSLFIVSRYREELAQAGHGPEALRRTLATAGRTVAFSALTVAAALASLVLFPLKFLYSMGLGGAIVALVAAGTALVALPALLALLGPRLDAVSLARWRAASARAARPASEGVWYRLAGAVTRRPAPVAAVATVVLLTLGLPFLGIKFTGVDARVLPTSASARQVQDALTRDFPPDRTSPSYLAVSAPPDAGGALGAYAQRLRRLPGVAAVAPPRSLNAGTWRIDVLSDRLGLAPASLDLVRAIRRIAPPYSTLVGGESAAFVDQKASLVDHLPLSLLILAATTLLVLWAMTGSVILPIKALLMNLLTISAAFGLLVLIFQDGRLEGLLDYRSFGALDLTQPVLLFAVAFGLSTDYGVFLLGRIKEARDHGAAEREAVGLGLERTGRIVTAAALLFCVAIGAFATSNVVFIKEVGVGTALAVAIDATIVRALLVPSLMALLGRRNWWAPAPLRRLHDRIGLRDGERGAA